MRKKSKKKKKEKEDDEEEEEKVSVCNLNTILFLSMHHSPSRIYIGRVLVTQFRPKPKTRSGRDEREAPVGYRKERNGTGARATRVERKG